MLRRLMIVGAAFALIGCSERNDEPRVAQERDAHRAHATDDGMHASQRDDSRLASENRQRDANERPDDGGMHRGARREGGDTRAGAVSDATFVREATIGNMMEIESGKIAARKAQDAEVKRFAERMITDHTKANNELAQIAADGRHDRPQSLPAHHRDMVGRLERSDGAAFDREYMRMMVQDHDKTVDMFAAFARDGKNEALRAFAARTLPILQDHQREARNIAARIGVETSGRTGQNMGN